MIDSFGENGTTAGGIRMNTLGKHYATPEDAQKDACGLALAMSDKNTSSRLHCGGCKTVLYTENESILRQSPGSASAQRSRLFDALAAAIGPNINNVLVGPDMNTSVADLKYLRAKLFEMYPHMKRCPVPSKMVTDEDVISVSTAWSTFGALLQLAEHKGWKHPKVVIQGLGNVGGKLAEFLIEKNWKVYGFDVREDKLAILPAENRLTKEQVLFEECDILAPCAIGGQFTPDVVKKIKCKAIAGAANLLIPSEHENEVLEILEERRIEYYSEIMINVGGVSFAVHSFTETPFTYQDSLELGKKNMQLMIHENSVITQYDTDEKRKFYATVMGDGTDNIHFGLWDGIDLDVDGAYGQASVNMTDWMWEQAMQLVPADRKRPMKYIDLGSGTGSAARHIVKEHSNVSATCMNLCRNQNKENENRIEKAGLTKRINVVHGSYEAVPDKLVGMYDGIFSQDAFVHAYSKLQALSEALRITKGGGWLVLSDLHCGDGPTVSEEELHTFAQTNMVKDWQTPEQVVKTAQKAGWTDVKFVDLTSHIRLSFQLMLKKVSRVIASGEHEGVNLQLLETYQKNLTRRVGQVDEGVFKWGALIARKPYQVVFTRSPPVAPEKSGMIRYSTAGVDGGAVKEGTDVVAVTIADKMTKEKLSNMPNTVRLIVTLSAGIDHIDLKAAKELGIEVAQAGREAITHSVADYLTATSLFALRGGFQNIGVAFPGKDWNLSWNADYIDLSVSTIGVLGMGRIAISYIERIRKLAPHAKIIYTQEPGVRTESEETRLGLTYGSKEQVLKESDLVLPLCLLTKGTEGLIGYDELCMMKSTATLINCSRGKVVDTMGLTKAMEEQKIRHAFLDCTDPEPLPEAHKLNKLENVTITPHFATNTTYVRKQLVEDIPRIVLSTLDGYSLELAAEEAALRNDLANGHAITRKFDMDELVWNHISAKMSDGSILITPGRKLFDEISVSDIVKSSDNSTADIIHQAIYSARPDVTAIIHLHTPAAVAVSCLDEGFQCLAQESAYFYKRVVNYEWQGISNDTEEKESIAKAINEGPAKSNTLLMKNHGFCTFGTSVAQAWVLAYYFEKSCSTLIKCLQTGLKINKPSDELLEKAVEQAFLPEFTPGACEWAALERLAKRV